MIRENGLNVKSIGLSRHAIERARQRVDSWKNANDSIIIGNIRALLKRAEFIGESVCEEKGNISLLYAVDRIGIYLSTDKKEVITVIKKETVTYKPLRDKMLELHKKEFRKLHRKECARRKRLEGLLLDCEVEIAELKRRKFKTRSQAVRNACDCRISAIQLSIQEYEDEIKAIQDEKRRVGKSLISVI
ncbi:hypothetical protein PQ478_09380 [Alkalihalophilus pseudofirmus]|uniref:hypothetical protein n=1 Tax=Alkalihalophilus pseudofirmus TaxID=79885 RepID=UPI00259B9960|nr:hypothetical protein [Alkalihalophilus pseudofirmus]WEG18679.1 hypothetical protein PQ478_09380 [Alkalihalophilus pseudofirmus]